MIILLCLIILFSQSDGSKNVDVLALLSMLEAELSHDSHCVEEGKVVSKDEECCGELEKVPGNGHLYHGAKWVSCETPPKTLSETTAFRQSNSLSETLLSHLLEEIVALNKNPIMGVSHRNVDWDCCALKVEYGIAPGKWGTLKDAGQDAEKRTWWEANNCQNAVCEHHGSGCKWSTGANHVANGDQIFNADGTGYTVVDSEDACKQHCFDTATCNGYNFNTDLKRCFVKSGVTELEDTKKHRHSGIMHCPESIKNCPAPSKPENGRWYCEDKKCFLQCNIGLAPDGRTTTMCSGGSWFPSLTEMSCSPAFVLVTGGLWKSRSVEVWGTDFHKMLPDMLGPRMGHTVENCDNHMIVCGGVPMEDKVFFPVPPAVRQCIEMQDDFTWKEYHPFTHVGRDIDANLVIHGSIYYLGGHSSPGTMEFMSPEGADNKEWTIENNFGGYKFKHSCAAKINPTEFIVTGGFFDAKLTVKYNVVTGEVTKLEDMNLCRSGHGCAYIKDDELGIEGIMAGGGYPLCNSEELNSKVSFALTSSSEFYDLKTGKWKQVGDMNKEKRGLDYIYTNGAVHAFGGMYRIIDDDPTSNVQMNYDGFKNVKAFRFGHEVERYDPKTETWSYLKDSTILGRNFFGEALISERKFFFGCLRPSAPKNGKFNCPTYPEKNEEKKCTLECDQGHAPQGSHTTICSEGSWVPALTEMTCASTRRT